MSNRIEIRTDIWKLNPNKPGNLILDRTFTIEEVFKNFTNALDVLIFPEIGSDCTALGNAERCDIQWGINPKDTWPSGKIKVIVEHGGSEGYYVTVSVVNKSTIIDVFDIKYFNHDLSWQVGRYLSDAFHEGTFG